MAEHAALIALCLFVLIASLFLLADIWGARIGYGSSEIRFAEAFIRNHTSNSTQISDLFMAWFNLAG